MSNRTDKAPDNAKGKQSSRGIRQATNAPESLDLNETNSANFKAMLETNEAVFDAMAAINIEIAAFASRRLQDNLARSEAMMKCEEPEDFLRAQFDYNKVVLGQYFNEAAKLMTMAARVTEQCLQPLQARSLSALREFHDHH